MTASDLWILRFCRVGFAGLSPVGPGTCGTAVACAIAPLVFLPLGFALRLTLLVLLFFAGSWAGTRAEALLGCKDPGQVVIDELVGVWIVLLPFEKPGISLVLAAFLFFRLFDIAKPWPVSAAEHWLPGGYGIMLDDVIAGIYALACVATLYWLGLIH